MSYALNLAEDGRILSATYEAYAAPGQPLVETLPEGNIYEYRYTDGAYTHDPLPNEEPEQTPTTEERLAALEQENAYLKETLEIILSGETGEVAADG